MIKLLWFFIINYSGLSIHTLASWHNYQNSYCAKPQLEQSACRIPTHKISLDEIRTMLLKEDVAMRPPVINKVLLTLKCARTYDTNHDNILTVIDYSLPSNKKRLWVFDLDKKTMLFHTYVSHGIKSGTLFSEYFSNLHNSKTSSIGVYRTEQAYYGRYGLALKLNGLERNFNNNAFNRAIVMHAGWYVDENFIQKYGRAGRSWGCPALPPDLSKDIIHTIKEDALFIAYYPSEEWYIQSKYLNCEAYCQIPQTEQLRISLVEPAENRDPILFIEKNNNNQREENEPIIAMKADDYQKIFSKSAPLKRMLRRQINQKEYIALNHDEFNTIVKNTSASSDENGFSEEIFFIIPLVKKVRGYYATEMHIVDVITAREIKEIQPYGDNMNTVSTMGYVVHFKKQPSIHLKSTNQFIRWLGL